MEWEEFLQLEKGNRVMTTNWDEATVKEMILEGEHKGEVLLYKFKIPNKRCKFFARHEIKSKL